MIKKPYILDIDASSRCQLKCPSCPTTEKGFNNKAGSGFLKFNDFKKIMDANPYIREVELDNDGEMFLNPELLAIVEYAYKKKVKLACNTGVNLNYATPEVLEGLVKNGFRALNCAIDGATPETYSIYRKGGDLNKVLENIKLINYFKDKYHSKFPELKWQFIVFGHNEHEIMLAKQMAQNLKMSFFAKMAWDSKYSPIKNRESVMAATGWLTTTREEYERLTGVSYVRSACYLLWRSPRINWDGRVLGCCWNVWSEFGGNVFSDGLIPCVDSEKINYAKQMLFGKKPARADIPCSTCEIYLKIRETNKYLTKHEFLMLFLSQFKPLLFVYRKMGIKRLRTLVSSLRNNLKIRSVNRKNRG
jgi:hypothetical protein